MRFPSNNKYLILFIFLSFTGLIKAQGKINVPAVECLGNLTSFTYTPPAGLTLSSANWDFGDGNASTNSTPLHTYAGKGFYKIKINAAFTNSTSRIDSLIIEVVGLPIAYFYLMPKSDSCLSKNILRYKDTSNPAKSGQTIISRLFVWGDGTFENTSIRKYGDVLSYTYPVAALYTLRMEITDKYGCKGSMIKKINILENIDADAKVDTLYTSCTSAQICVLNTSTGSYRKSGDYKWLIDTTVLDTNSHFTTKRCVSHTKERTGNIVMTVTFNGACPDTFRQGFYNRLDALPTKVTLSDSIWCWGNEGLVGAYPDKTAASDKFTWFLGGISLPCPYPKFFRPPNGHCINPQSYIQSDSQFFFLPKMWFIPGMAKVSLVLYRGPSVCIVHDSLRVLGPIARMIVYDDAQCYTKRQAFFIDDTRYVNKKNLIYRWNIHDVDGDNCTSNRAKDINKYKNCNRSVDWYTKHLYNNFGTKNETGLWVKDTVTGCEDTTSGNVNFRNCPPVLRFDSISLCQGEHFLNVAAPFPEYVTFDSGKNWKKFAVLMDSTYNGLYDIGFAFKNRVSPWAENFGDDSIKTHTDTITYLDTVYKKKFLRVSGTKMDTFQLRVYGICNPFRATLYLKNKRFLKGESLSVNWQHGISFGMTFKRDTIIDSVFHIYNIPGTSSTISISIVSRQGCRWRKGIDINFGKTYSVYVPDKGKLCMNTPICLYATVYEFPNRFF